MDYPKVACLAALKAAQRVVMMAASTVVWRVGWTVAHLVGHLVELRAGMKVAGMAN
jgi:hypothetical protein